MVEGVTGAEAPLEAAVVALAAVVEDGDEAAPEARLAGEEFDTA